MTPAVTSLLPTGFGRDAWSIRRLGSEAEIFDFADQFQEAVEIVGFRDEDDHGIRRAMGHLHHAGRRQDDRGDPTHVEHRLSPSHEAPTVRTRRVKIQKDGIRRCRKAPQEVEGALAVRAHVKIPVPPTVTQCLS